MSLESELSKLTCSRNCDFLAVVASFEKLPFEYFPMVILINLLGIWRYNSLMCWLDCRNLVSLTNSYNTWIITTYTYTTRHWSTGLSLSWSMPVGRNRHSVKLIGTHWLTGILSLANWHLNDHYCNLIQIIF